MGVEAQRDQRWLECRGANGRQLSEVTATTAGNTGDTIRSKYNGVALMGPTTVGPSLYVFFYLENAKGAYRPYVPETMCRIPCVDK